MMKHFFACFFLIAPFLISAQEMDTIPRKKITIPRIEEPPKIDGYLNDAAWQNAPVAKNFVERMPSNG
ncbi:hypothetical protein LZ575_07280 [Antarcticibacterium sp. 1MA-6-2]|uniref:hypothetical protein n=1 Tax=Antarcticibacterium sp. 1MA-6-2 TaxID=2908210 RepID=UPI001F2EA38C|nr:hypothetical protein [Antarcticibacterium sp. 1MA-6-2]UJH92324.1 hypothetical protein LZ575_07280 [Antarcticibacterium sp. 1MA-6-2]